MVRAEKRKVIRGHTVDIYYDPDDHKSSGLLDFVESMTATQYLNEPEYCI